MEIYGPNVPHSQRDQELSTVIGLLYFIEFYELHKIQVIIHFEGQLKICLTNNSWWFTIPLLVVDSYSVT